MSSRFALILAFVLLAPSSRAEVTGFTLTDRRVVADGESFGTVGAYERIRGTLRMAIDPTAPANQMIVDVGLAPRDDTGKIIFETEVVVLRPVDPAKRNGALLYDVNNRGNIAILGQINGKSPTDNDPIAKADSGNGFLQRHGFTLVASAWTFDVEPPTGTRKTLILNTPRVADAHLRGRIVNEFTVEAPSPRARITGAAGTTYAPSDTASAVLTWRDRPQGRRYVVPRATWAFVPAPQGDGVIEVIAADGFVPGRLYEVAYETDHPRVVGLGLAAIRDVISHLRYQPFEGHPALGRTLIFGISQSGRVIQTMILQGFLRDEAGRRVIDGAFIHVAGAGKGSFNHRFATPTRHFSMLEEQVYPTDYFPFSTGASSDQGRVGSLLDKARSLDAVPKIFAVNTSAEYWSRGASLVTTTSDGTRDLAPDPSARIYHLAGGQHYVGRARTRGNFTQCVNTLDHYVAMRALLLALDAWVKDGTTPPPSRYPSLAAGTLVTPAAYASAVPAIPGLARLDGPMTPPRLDFGSRFATEGIADKAPPVVKGFYRSLVPAPDSDGLDRDGVRLVEMEVPLGTHLGWNPRDPKIGFPWASARFDGSFIPFPRDEAEREAAKDPRPSLAARYPTKAVFVTKTEAALDKAIAQGFVLADERTAILARRSKLYDQVLAHAPGDASCEYIHVD